jgi:Mor family transcriptional regulator
MGEEAAEKFIKTYSGERFPVARCEAALRDARDTEIIAKYDSGVSGVKLAIEYGMTERNVRTILKRIPEGMEGAA